MYSYLFEHHLLQNHHHYKNNHFKKMTKKALVFVLGDLARSPRMQYHCMSLAKSNYEVTVIANESAGDKSCEELESNPSIKQKLITANIDFRKYLPSSLACLAYIMKPIWQSFILIYYLCMISLVQVIIVQNPPSIPSLPILCLYSKLTGTKLIIDWHNYGFTILSLNLKPNHPFVKISASIEIFFGRMANAGFCVSEAMRKDLIETFQIKYPLYVLYDKPPKHFKPFSLREKHNFFVELKNQIPEFKSPIDDDYLLNGQNSVPNTRFTLTDAINKNVIMPRSNRPAVIMSSTSWTEDEDFGLLLDALKRYDLTRNYQLINEEERSSPDESDSYLPSLVCVITGKGPLKEYYETKIAQCNFKHIDVVLPWLTASEYAKMVASCDLGISLHSSSSGVDLPMKVVDMFGCGIPVLAYNYKAISELVVEDYYGLTFNDSGDLFNKLVLLLKDFYTENSCSRGDSEYSLMGRYKKNIKRHYLLSRWEDNWQREARPVFDKLLAAPKVIAQLTK